MRLPLALMAAGLIIAALLSAPLAWDGSYWLFKTLDLQFPYVSNGRFSNVLVEAPVALASYLTDNMAALRLLFGLPYAALPLLALAASWWIVRERARWLFVWAAFGIGLATLPGQMCFVCEGDIVVQFFWPLFLAILVGLPRRALPVAIVVVPFLFFLHPSAALLFLMGAAAAVLVAVLQKRWRRRLLLFGGVLLAAAVAAAVRLQLSATVYEGSQISLDLQMIYFRKAIAGLPLAVLVATWLTSFLVLAARHLGSAAVRHILARAALVGLAVAAGLLIAWALQPRLWQDELLFKTFAVFIAVPLLLCAFIDAMVGEPPEALRLAPSYDATLTVGIAGIFLTVIVIQSVLFNRLSAQMMDQIAQVPGGCVEKAAVTAIQRTALDHWSTVTLAIDYQGRTPQKLVLDNRRACFEAAGSDPIQIVPWEIQGEGWFHLQPARASIALGGDCAMVFSRGWYEIEGSDDYLWVWNSGLGRLLIFADRPRQVELTGDLSSVPAPNVVDILANGEVLLTVSADSGALQPIPSLPLNLRRGENIIAFVSHREPVQVPGDDRLLAVALGNLQVRMASGHTCELVR